MLGTRYTVDSDGDVEMSIPQPIFEVIRPQSFQAGSMQRSFTGTGSVNPKTLKNLAVNVLKKPMSSVTDTDIMDSVVERCGTLKNDFVPDLTAMFNKQLKMDLSIDDCDARIFRYFEDFNGIIADNGLRHLIGTDNESEDGYKNRMKTRCRLLVENLQPSVLKAQIDYDARGDSKSKIPEGKLQRSGNAKSAPTNTAPSHAPAPSTQAPRPPRSLPHDGCLHCKGGHWLKDCLTATVAQQAEAREKFQEAKEKRLPALSQLDAVIGRRDDVDFVRASDLDVVDEQVETLRRSLHGMHKNVQDKKERRHVQDMAAHKGSISNFDVGDFVLWSRIDQRLPNNKLLGQWAGLFKVTEAKPHSFVIQHLISDREYDVHASRLKFYADSELNQTAELLQLVSRQGMVLGVEDIRNHRFNDALDRWELQVS
ncbi:hypothetical protein PC110_g22179, partial [Phytophthora cactorum]